MPQDDGGHFRVRVASAFFLWPKELLETDLNRKVLASTVQHDLFDGSPDGWKAYVAQASVEAAPVAEWDAPDEKKGWPWPQPGSTS